MCENLQKVFEEAEFDGTWGQFKTEIYNFEVEALSFRVGKHLDWFDKNDKKIIKFLGDKNLLH